MTEWSRSEVMSGLALIISALGFVVSFLSYRRASKTEEPNLWVEVESIGVADCWRASIHLSNPTKYVLKFHKFSTEIQRVPVDDKQDFLLGDYQLALSECGNDLTKLASVVGGKDRYLSVTPTNRLLPIEPGTTGTFHCLLFRGRLSAANKVQFNVAYYLMDGDPRYIIATAFGEIPGKGLQFQIQRH